MRSLEEALQKAIEARCKEIVEEEVAASSDRIRARLTADAIQMAPQVMKHLSPFGGEIIISLKPR